MSAQAGFVPHVMTLGQGPRRVLALHCTMAFGGAWGGLARLLGDRQTFVAPDMPSHGGSVDWDEVSDFGDTVHAAAASLLDDDPMDVIGHSFGAAIALRLATTHPGRVRSLTLFEPPLFSIALRDAPETMIAHDTELAPFFEAMAVGDMALGARRFNAMWGGGAKWDTLSERSRNAMVRSIHVVPSTFDFLYHDNAGLIAPGVLKAINIPALLMRGAQTHPAMTAVNDGLARRLGNAEQAVIEGAGHMGPVTHPQAIADLVAGMLDRT